MKIEKSLRIEFITLSTHSNLICSIFLMNKKRYIEHNNICGKRRRSAEVIIRKNSKIASTI